MFLLPPSVQQLWKKFEQKTSHEKRKKIKKVENKINKLEKEITKLEFKFVDFRYGTPEFIENQKKLDHFKKEIENTIKQWEKLNE